MITRLLFICGYSMALPLTCVVRRIVRRRWLRSFLALEAGTGLIVAGWVRSRQPVPTAINAAALVGFASWYALTGRPATSDY
jgi:hypothetical protein